MSRLYDLFPTPDDLLALTPDELAPILLRLAADSLQPGGMVTLDHITHMTVGTGMAAEQMHAYGFAKRHQVDALVNETWEYLRQNGFILPAPGFNGQNGWMVFSRKGQEALAAPDGFDRIRALQALPKELLHPSIAKDILAALRRGDLPGAVSDAFITVEMAAREAGGFTANDLGVDLMRQAFNSTAGPLRDQSLSVESERKGYEHLFAGAIGAFKNPHSHRKVKIDDLLMAIDQVLLASHLLRIIDAARARNAAGSAKP